LKRSTAILARCRGTFNWQRCKFPS
jgi:hypothetical protein